MTQQLPPFPVDDVTLSNVEHAMDGALIRDDSGELTVHGAEFGLPQLLDFLAGHDRDSGELLEGAEMPGFPGVPVYLSDSPTYHEHDVIRALIAEVRRLRGLS